MESLEVDVRDEEPFDHDAVRAINEAAFDTAAEANLVDTLRTSAMPCISLVAEVNGEVVGHIMFTPVTLDDAGGLVMGLAPMAVAPDSQRHGIGSALVREGLARCGRLGAIAVVVLGHPEFYPRFGFVPASRFDIGCEYDVPDEAFMAIELAEGSLDCVSGTARYHAAFGSL